MTITLFEQHEREFTSNGLGILDDVLKCEVTEVRNGKFELLMEYPIQGNYANDIVVNNYILAPPNDTDPDHPFRIYEVDTDLDSNKMTVKAVTKVDELSGNIVKPFTVEHGDAFAIWNTAKTYAMDPITYTFQSRVGTMGPLVNDKITNVLAILKGDNSITSNIGGELKYGKDSITLYTLRGREHVTTIRPRKNLKNIKITTNMNGKYTRILPFAKYTPEGENQKEVTVYGDVVRSDHYDDYVVKRIVPVDLSSKFNEYKSRQKNLRKTKIAEERASNRAADAAARSREASEKLALEAAREKQRVANFNANKQKRLDARAASVARRGRSSGGKRSKAQIESDRQARYQASDAAFEKRQSELERKFNEQQANRAKAKNERAAKKAAREEEKARRAARMADIKDQTKIVITKAMVDAEAATYFDDNPGVDIPNIKIEVDMIPVKDTTTYEKDILAMLNDIRLCDTIDVYVPKLDVDVTLKVIEIQYDCLAKRILKIVASTEDNLPSNIMDSQRGEYKDITKAVVNEAFEDLQTSINTVITSANGNNRNFYGPDEPPAEGLKENDLWFKDVGEGLVDMYRYDGTQWILVLPNNLGEVLEQQIDDAVAEIHELLDEYTLDTDTLFGELVDLTDDAFKFIAESKESIESEVSSAKSKLEQVENEFNKSKQYLNDRLIQIAQDNLNTSHAIMTRIEKEVKTLERSIQTSYSQLRIGTSNILSGVMDMPDNLYRGGRLKGETFKVYNREVMARHLYNTESITYIDDKIKLVPGKQYTFSFYAKIEKENELTTLSLPEIQSSTPIIYSEGVNGPYTNGWQLSSGGWNRFSLTFTASDHYVNHPLRIQLNLKGTTSVYTAAWQLEESNILSDWHPNTAEIEQNLAKYKEGIDGRLTLLQRTLGDLQGNLQQVTTKIEEVPGKINLQVSTAKTELKQYTDSQIQISENRITSNVTSNLNGLLSSSVTQTSGIIRQAITSANEATRSYAQSIVQQEADARTSSLSQINNQLSEYNIVKERVDLFSRTIGRTEDGISTNIANMLMTNNMFQTMISNVDARSNNLIQDTDTFRTMKKVNPKNIEIRKYEDNAIDLYASTKLNVYGGFTLPVNMQYLQANSKYTISFILVIREFYPGETQIGVQLKNHHENKSITFHHVAENSNPQKYTYINVKKTITVNEFMRFNSGSSDIHPFYVWLNGRGHIQIRDIMLVEGEHISPIYKPNNALALTSLVKLTNSQYAVNILSGSRELITEINASPEGVRIKGKSIELDGNVLIRDGIIKNSMIGDAAITNAKIANASIIDSQIVNLNANKITGLEAEFRKISAKVGIFDSIFTSGIFIGRSTLRFSNGALSIMREGGTTTEVTIRSNGRYSGPAQFNGRVTNSTDYVPVMTNLYQDYPLSPVSNRKRDIGIYGVRALFLMTFSGQTNEYGSSGWLYVNDGSGQNHTWYVPMKKARTQINWHSGFDS